MLDQNSKKRKVLLMTWENNFCWKSAAIVLLFGAFEIAIISVIILTMELSHQAGLNVGIAISIWAINPFFVALVEKIRFNNSLTVS